MFLQVKWMTNGNFFETPFVLGLVKPVMLYSDLPGSAFLRIAVSIKHGIFLLGTGHT